MVFSYHDNSLKKLVLEDWRFIRVTWIVIWGAAVEGKIGEIGNSAGCACLRLSMCLKGCHSSIKKAHLTEWGI